MNHLCGLDLNPNPNGVVPEGALLDLRKLRTRYDGSSPSLLSPSSDVDANQNGDNNDADEKKKNGFDNSDSTKTNLPSYQIFPHRAKDGDDDPQLPPSGWRPLDDATLYRFLAADRKKNSFDVDASYERLLSAMKFRKDNGVDLIVREIVARASSSSLSLPPLPPVVAKCQRLRVAIWAGVDRQHRPVVFERLGEFFSSGNAKAVSEDDWIRAYLYFLEQHFYEMRVSAIASGKSITRFSFYADFQGVVSSIMSRKIWSVTPLLKALVNAVECHYPEIADRIVLFNVPRIASVAFRVVKAFLDPVTAEKIEVFSGVPLERFKEEMLVEVIPKEYGGANEMEYPNTSSK